MSSKLAMGSVLSIAASLLVAGAFLLPAGTAFHRNDLPAIVTAAGDPSDGWGVRVDKSAVGDLAVDLNGVGPNTGSQVSFGAAFFDQAKNFQFMFAFTIHFSPDREIIHPNPLAPVITDPDATSGDPAELPEGTEYQLFIGPELGGSGPCPFACLGITVPNAAVGSHFFVAWAGGLTSTELVVRGDPATTTATLNAGSATVLGDAELPEAMVNLQVQKTVNTLVAGNQPVGVKVIIDGAAPVTAANNVYGFFALSDFKLVCQFNVFGCLFLGGLTSALNSFCVSVAGVNCGTGVISWDGPGGIGGEGSTIYAYLGTPPGAYTFRVDQKVDAYGPIVFNPTTGTFVFAGEHFSFLTVADASLP